MRRLALGVGVILIAVGGYFFLSKTPPEPVIETSIATDAEGPMVAVIVPELTGNAVIGARIFNAKCAACHGENASGIDGAGPPLIHKIYEPSHHGDGAFVIAARNGVRQHHWPFGDMPRVFGVNDAEIKMVIAYVRALQRANGIN